MKRILRPAPPGGWHWSHRYACGLELTLSGAVTDKAPHWCEACQRAYSGPCHRCGRCSWCVDALGFGTCQPALFDERRAG